MRVGETKAREGLMQAVALTLHVPDQIGVDNPTSYDKELLEACKEYVNTVVGPNFCGDRC